MAVMYFLAPDNGRAMEEMAHLINNVSGDRETQGCDKVWNEVNNLKAEMTVFVNLCNQVHCRTASNTIFLVIMVLPI